MSTDFESSAHTLKLANPRRERKRAQRRYSDEDRHIALAAVDLNGGNIYRTARALNIPHKTLEGWVKARGERALQFAEGRREKRGDLCAKMESLIHDCVEAMPAKIPKATLSQTAVAVGVLTDKVRILRNQGLESDPVQELCRLLGIHSSQLPDRFELPPGYKFPAGFLLGSPIEVQAELKQDGPRDHDSVNVADEGVEDVGRQATDKA